MPGGLGFRLEDVAFIIIADGASPEIYEHIEVNAPVVNRWEEAPHWLALPEVLASEMNRRTAAVLEEFVDP